MQPDACYCSVVDIRSLLEPAFNDCIDTVINAAIYVLFQCVFNLFSTCHKPLASHSLPAPDSSSHFRNIFVYLTQKEVPAFLLWLYCLSALSSLALLATWTSPAGSAWLPIAQKWIVQPDPSLSWNLSLSVSLSLCWFLPRSFCFIVFFCMRNPMTDYFSATFQISPRSLIWRWNTMPVNGWSECRCMLSAAASNTACLLNPHNQRNINLKHSDYNPKKFANFKQA